LLVDESELFRRGVRSALSDHPRAGCEVVGEAGSIAAAAKLCAELKPQVLLADIRLPDGSGAELFRQASRLQPALRAIILTGHSTDNFVFEAITAGVHGYLLKNVSPAELIGGIHDVAAGRSILAPDATARVLRLLKRENAKANALSILSPQERRVLALVAEGLTNKQVGARLGLSNNTVKNYLITVFEKLRVKRRAQAAALYVQAEANK
jgi:two-component system, NarL family, response regulator DevR